MDRKGSITVFLTLVLSLMLSLVCTSIESVRMAAARTQILSSLDIGLYSLFGQYDKTLLKDYDLFLLDGSWGGGMLDMAKVYDNMESYIKPVLRQNSQKLSLVEGGFTGCRLATDEEGEAFYCQVVQYMKDTLGSQGIQLLTERMRERENKTKEAEETGKQAQSKDAIGSYEREMNEAAKKQPAGPGSGRRCRPGRQWAGGGASGKSAGGEKSYYRDQKDHENGDPGAGDPAGERDFREPRIQRDPGFRKDASGGDASLWNH